MMQMHFQPYKANLAEIQSQNHQNVQKCIFSQQVPGVNGLIASGNDQTFMIPSLTKAEGNNETTPSE